MSVVQEGSRESLGGGLGREYGWGLLPINENSTFGLAVPALGGISGIRLLGQLPLDCFHALGVLGVMLGALFRSAAATIAISFLLAEIGHSDELTYWTTINAKKIELNDKWRSASHLQLRSPEIKFLQYGRFSQKFLRSLDEHWTLGIHPAIEFGRRSGGDSWDDSYRVEVEAEGRFSFQDGPDFASRTRWEARLRDSRGGEVTHRIRQRFKATWGLEGLGAIQSYTLQNESFYELKRGQIVANRFFPIYLGVSTGRSFRLGGWLMYLSQRSRSSREWGGSYVLGLDVNF